jgi:hypothetical protein
MKTILNGAMSLDEYLRSQASGQRQEHEEVSLTLSCDSKVEVDGFRRLRRSVERLNENIQKNSLQVLNKDGVWVDVASDEEMKNISVPLPEGLSNIEQLKRIECFASEAKQRMGGLSYDVAELTRDYNLI